MKVIVTALLFAAAAAAQTSTATVVGRVTDATGAVVPAVEIKITNLGTNIAQAGTSNEVGDFTIPLLNPGRYTLEASSKGFHTYKHSEFTTNLEIAEIPLDGRNFSDLAYLTGGVIPRGDGGDGSFAVNGARADNGGFMIDGMNNTQRRNTGAMINPPLEGVQEFKMMTSGYSAEYGRYAGGMLTVVTKSGTNRLRGAMYEFLRNDALDATGYFDVEKSKLRRNQFGATVGG